MDSSENSSPLGLTLRKTPSFVDLVHKTLAKGKEKVRSMEMNLELKSKSSQTKRNSEKVKASNFPAKLLRIGTWQVFLFFLQLLFERFSWYEILRWCFMNGFFFFFWKNINSTKLLCDRGWIHMKGIWLRRYTTRNEKLYGRFYKDRWSVRSKHSGLILLGFGQLCLLTEKELWKLRLNLFALCQ